MMQLLWSLLISIGVVGLALLFFEVLRRYGLDPIGSLAGLFGGSGAAA